MLIDDFSTGAYLQTLDADSDLDVQSGAMLGGMRRTNFILASSQYGMGSDLKIGKPGHLALAAGPGVAHRLELTWGVDSDGQVAPLDLDLSANDSLRIDFGFLDQVLNFNVVLFTTHGGNRAQAGVNLSPFHTPSAVELDFDDFSLVGDFSFADVDMIMVIAQTGGPYFSHDYVISRISSPATGTQPAPR